VVVASPRSLPSFPSARGYRPVGGSSASSATRPSSTSRDTADEANLSRIGGVSILGTGDTAFLDT